AAAVDWDAVVVDVGGGNGTLLAAILRAHSSVRGILLEAPAVVARAGAALATAGVADRCPVVAGDFFAAVPPGGNVYVLKWILHDWDDDRAAAILRNCRREAAPGARLRVVELVLPAPPAVPDERQFWARQSDLYMLILL